ncbi:MarR family transcriptional regulator [Alteromonas sp. ZYF713]|nr:MarR family transcriptional regulator [Alteromonas sp. ZYF713]
MQFDLVDTLLAEWKKEKPELQGEGMAVVARVLNLANKFEQEISGALKEYGINYTDFDVLATLRRKGAPYKLSPGTLQEAVILTSGAMTACLKRLENRELLKRMTSESDRRGVDVQLTAKGKKLIDDTIAMRFNIASASVKALSSVELDSLTTLLRKISKA